MADYDEMAWAKRERVKKELREAAKGEAVVMVTCVVCGTAVKPRGHCQKCGTRERGLAEKRNKVTKNRVKDLDS